ncbi:MAG: hypothetical protein JXR78_08145 [Victivallales bacterium]|nr:hypothetical protein [Victivallales bacterium]
MYSFSKRNSESLNGIWDFKFNDDHNWNDENIGSINYDDRITVPSAFDAMPAYNGKRGVGFYRRCINVPSGRRAKINFNAVGMYAKIFIDGRKVGEQYAAYTPFSVNIPAEDREKRELVVMTCNRFDYEIYPLHEIFFDFYAYGGIFRDIELQVLPDGDTLDWLGVDTLDYRSGEIKVRVKPVKPGNVLKISFDGETPETLTVDKVSGNEFVFKHQLADFTPWSPELPELHTVCVDNGTDSISTRFGIRQVAAQNGKILLNGKAVKLLGYCRHEAHPQYGPALPLSQLIADLQLLRGLGCNFVRGSHYQQDPRFLELCDEMGFLVFEESMGWGQSVKHFTDPVFIEAQIKQTAAMIETSYNHPSVIMRGFLNEGESDKEESRGCYEALVKLLKAKDPHRLITYASNREERDLFLEMVDVICFNIYPAWYSENRSNESPLDEIIPRIHRNINHLKERGLADKPYIISEIGAGAIYGWRDPICAYWSEEYQREYLSITCKEVLDNDAIAGVALWQFCDCRTYRGSGALGRPRSFNNKGTFDEYRRPKLAAEAVANLFKGYKK